MIVEATQVRRRKQHYSKERNKIFLRQLCEQNETGIWTIKVSKLMIITKNSLNILIKKYFVYL